MSLLHPSTAKELANSLPIFYILGIGFSLCLLAVIMVMIANRDKVSSAGRLVGIRYLFHDAARDCGLTTRVRKSKWIVEDGQRKQVHEQIEHFPKIKRGRMLPNNVGVEYEVKPAKGRTLDDVANAADQLAAHLRVEKVRVEKLTPYKGKLIILFANPLAETIHPD